MPLPFELDTDGVAVGKFYTVLAVTSTMFTVGLHIFYSFTYDFILILHLTIPAFDNFNNLYLNSHFIQRILPFIQEFTIYTTFFDFTTPILTLTTQYFHFLHKRPALWP